jgi:hypothetical protein
VGIHSDKITILLSRIATVHLNRSHFLVRFQLVRTDVSEELRASIIEAMKALSSSGTSVLTRDERRNIPENAILLSKCRENLKSYKISA